MEQALTDIIVAQYGPDVLILVILLVAFWKLFTVLRKVREEAAYQLNFDLISKRATAYASLWSKMGPLAIYSNATFDTGSAKKLGASLSDWYFSETGGLYLSYRARDFYFALQYFLQSIADIPGWVCMQRPQDTRVQFVAMLKKMVEEYDDISDVINRFSESGQDQIDPNERHDMAGRNDDIGDVIEKLTGERPDQIDSKTATEISNQNDAIRHVMQKLEDKNPNQIESKKWTSACESISRKLAASIDSTKADAGDLIFVSAQQISSILRSNLADEVHSRLSGHWPETRIRFGKGDSIWGKIKSLLLRKK